MEQKQGPLSLVKLPGFGEGRGYWVLEKLAIFSVHLFSSVCSVKFKSQGSFAFRFLCMSINVTNALEIKD